MPTEGREGGKSAMLRRSLAVLPLLLIAFALPASAGVVIEFESGLFLEVHSYALLEDQVRLHIASNSYVVVPRSTLAKIESDGRVVYRHPPVPPTHVGDDDDRADATLLARSDRTAAPVVAALAPASASYR